MISFGDIKMRFNWNLGGFPSVVMPWVGLPRLVLGGPHFALHAVWRASLGLPRFGLLGFGGSACLGFVGFGLDWDELG